ncbi:metal-dependent hydrolase [Halorussus amylolyticus]|uniref:metal-dependent hydrolase n=1 Tax=Halorussus amylolyticus TaxID=1126242 RepID=UPI00138F3502|nr:metal-dependent hydrolase [Halorussus amylolyticus]
MFRPGHYGVALTLYAPVGCWLLALGHPTLALAGGAGLLWLAMLPDWDTWLPLISHRGPTHTLAFAGLVAGAAWVAAAATGFGTHSVGPVDLRTFAAGIAALSVLSHLAADVLTPMGVALLWPVTSRRFTLSVCRANNRIANYLLFALGVFATASAASFGTMLFSGAV